MTRIFALIFILMTMPALPAQASFWMECEFIVSGNITPDQNGLYTITPIASLMVHKGIKSDEPCRTPNGDAEYPIRVKIAGDKPKGMKTIALHYKFFNGMGPHGVINSESWTFVPTHMLGRVFK